MVSKKSKSRKFSKKSKKISDIQKEASESEGFKKKVEFCSENLKKIREEVGRFVFGQERVVDSFIRGFLANGHVLIEGVPGVAKTVLIKTLAKLSGCDSSRVQFTVDLLPTDITGFTTYDEHKQEYSVVKGPVFSNFLIADEINRAPPKTQSALLEAMEERHVTIGRKTFSLPSPFFVMANNNPLESSGTYPLPEAQVDRFLFKVKMGYVSKDHEVTILDKNASVHKFENFDINALISPKKILEMQDLTKKIYASKRLKEYIVRLVDATRNPKDYGLSLGKYIEWGCSPRAGIGLLIASKADALYNGSHFVTPKNVQNIIHDVLRHRIILNYQGQAENIGTDEIIDEVVNKVALP